MWSHPKLKNEYVGNYELRQVSPWDAVARILRLEHRNSKGLTIGKVYEFGNAAAARKAGWVYAR